MFVGRPPGNYDRILDFSRAMTGTLFFVPSATFLDNVNPDATPEAAPSGDAEASQAAGASATTGPSPAAAARSGSGSLNIGSLNIGSLKGD